MNKKNILNLAKELIEANQGNLHNPEGLLKHLECTYDIAGEITEKILLKYPKIKINKKEVSLAGGLHDIARPLKENQIFHELRGAEYIERNGLKKKVADSLVNVYRIAQMFRSHGFVYERFIDPENADLRKEFEPIEISLLIPRTWQEAIVTISEASNIDGERVDIEDKIIININKYKTDSKYQSDMVARSIKKGEKRTYKLYERVKALSEGKLSENDIMKYGFL